ncbi:MAG: cobalt/nickel transport system permease protein [Solirubrobacteraceae bacterium]|nr:cobalt/nickel transport system permease protein [Solirubrobacteraceae bacterium]
MTVAHMAPAAPVQTALHRLAPEAKVAATLAFVISVALVPRGVAWPYAVDLALLAALAAWARAPLSLLARRLAIEVPFVAFVVVLPFAAHGPRVHVLGVGLAHEGLSAAGEIVAKATLAVLATGVLGATTPPAAIVAGLGRLRVPALLTGVAALAIRYLQLVLDDLGRARRARIARGDDPRWLWQARATARGAGGLAARSLARGERVHIAMLARGFDGRLPVLALAPAATVGAWVAALTAVLPAVAASAVAAGGLR